jgi:uncharacterized protein (TIGR00255 family)
MTVKSMTGFGRASAEVADRRLRVEIRSVNHRGLDLKIRSQEPDAYCDAEIARAVRAAIDRGAVTVQIREESSAGTDAIDETRVRLIHRALEKLRGELGIGAPVSLEAIAAFMGGSAGAGLRGEPLWEALRPALTAALEELVATRAREGAALGADLEGHRTRLAALAGELGARTAALPERFARRLADRLATLRGQPGFEPGRLAEEAALMAERLDVAEELVRLDTHLGHLAQLLGEAGAVGRKLDFVIQEIGRELNTAASKAQDADMAAMVIDAKAELEKLREQAQNVE